MKLIIALCGGSRVLWLLACLVLFLGAGWHWTGAGAATVALSLSSAQADLALAQTATPNPVLFNNRLTYTLTIMNNGPDEAADVVLRVRKGAPPL